MILTRYARWLARTAVVLAVALAGAATAAEVAQRPRLLVLTDIGGDPDDQQALIRLLLYSNEFEIEGLVASASGTPNELKEKVTKPQLIREIVEAYGKVRPNLVRHAEGYPTPDDLLAKVKAGSANRGKEAVGDGKDSEGSQWIIATVDRSDPRPLNISIWGGQTDLAQALWRVRQDRGAEGLAAFVKRFRVYDIADQDRIASWMWDQFPGMFYVLCNTYPRKDRREGAFRGLYLGGDESLVSRKWMDENIRQDHGPLGALYPPKTWTAPNPHSAIKEGDTPSWFYFLPNGLSDPDHPEWGCWGGRFQRDDALGGGRSRIYRDARDALGNVNDARVTVWRWRPAFQADFQARLDWCVQDSGAKPVGVVSVNDDASRKVLTMDAAAGQEITVKTATDGRSSWFVYQEAGSYRGEVSLRLAADGKSVTFTTPMVAEHQTVHLILHVQGKTDPALSAYRRVVVTVRPAKP